MAEAINAQNIGAYLQYLAHKLQQPLPAPFNNSASLAGRPDAEIAAALEALYAKLGLPNQTGWSYEDAFLKEAPLPAAVPTMPPPMPAYSAVPGVQPGLEYYPVAPGIGRTNFKPFLYWAEDRLKRSLDLFGIGAWDNYSDEAVRQSIIGIYRAANILPDEAKQLELGFLAVYHQKVAPVPVNVPNAPASQIPVTQMPPQARPVAPQSTGFTQRTTRKSRRYLLPVIALLVVGAIGLWLWREYSAYQRQATVYALTNNIALRKDASDTSPVVGRMDIYGQYLDAKNVKQTSASQLKLSTDELTNGFYKATNSSSFWSFLTGSDSTMFVHTKYVTTDKAIFDKYSEDLSALKNDFNELDKLGFIYRQLIGRAVLKSSDGAALKIAASCRPSPKMSRTAPLSIGKYRNTATGELDVIIQATDGYCYTLQGGENELPPTLTPVVIRYGGTYNEPMKSGGMFTKVGSSNTLRFEYCNNGQVFFSQPPYTMFAPLQVPVPEPVDDNDDDGVQMDTAVTTF